MGVPALLTALSKGDSTSLERATGPDGQNILRRAEAERLVGLMRSFSRIRYLEESTWDDLPRIVVSRKTEQDKILQREFSQLSLGQQQSIILAILLSVDHNAPLLVDQPEDNLDSAFIFQILVRALRRIKEHRQVILVTHNANIAVLGDSDQVIPLRSTATKGVVMTPGTVECPKTRKLTCQILEGGEAAYVQRGVIYGLPT